MEKVLLMNWDGIKGLSINLGIANENFRCCEDTADTLVEILDKLIPDDGYSWDVHFQLLELQFVEKQLWPVLKYMDGDKEIFKHALNLAKNLSVPEVPPIDNGPTKYNTLLRKVNKIAKQRFVEIDLGPVLFENIFNILEKSDDEASSSEVITCISDSLKLFHNLLWSPEDNQRDDDVNSVAMCLLKDGLIKFIDHSIHSSSKAEHHLGVSQVLHVLFKSDPGLRKCLLPTVWKKEGDIILDKNESCMGSLGSASSVASDDLDNDNTHDTTTAESSGTNILLENPLTLDNWVFKASGSRENFSKASHLGKRQTAEQAGFSVYDSSSFKFRKSLDGCRMESFDIWSTKEYVREALKDFVSEFMTSSFNVLVETFLKSLTDKEKRLEFPDLETYFTLLDDFIPYASLTSWKNIESAFCVDTFSFLLYDGISLSEEIMLRVKEQRDSSELHQRCFKCVQIWQKMVKCLSNFMENTENKAKMTHITESLRQLEQIWQFFLFMMRMYNPDVHDKQSIDFLKSLVVTNHRLVILLDDKKSFHLRPVIQQFAKVDMMDKYTILLQQFATNGNFLNNCLFTMMHHIAGDCDKLDVLIKPKTLNTLVQITEHELPLAEVFEDLIDYVFDRFINLIEGNPTDCAALLNEDGNRNSTQDESVQDDCPPPWTELENTYLCLHYLENYMEQNLLPSIQDKLASVKISKSQQQILKQLFYVGLLEDNEFKKFDAKFVKEKQTKTEVCFSDMENAESVETCLKKIIEKDGQSMIQWLQMFLLEACYVKLGGKSLQKDEEKKFEEPIQHVSLLLQDMVPLVPFTYDQEKILSNQYFNKLLEELNFVMPQESHMIYPRIPHSWTPKDLYEKALLLAGYDKSALPEMKFTQEELDNAKNGFTEIADNFFDEDLQKPSF